MTVAIILASHGELARGMHQSVNMIMGEQDDLYSISFSEGTSPDDFQQVIEAAVNQIVSDVPILALVDLYGGTPFNKFEVLAKANPDRMLVLAGLNLPLVIEALMARYTSNSIDQIAQYIIPLGQEGIKANRDLVIASERSDSNTASTSKAIPLAESGLIHVRVDERMIHGQVATLWLGSLGANRIMVVDDEVVLDDIAKASLKTAIPNGTKLSILRTQTAVDRLNSGQYQGQKVFLITKKLSTVFDMIDKGLAIRAFNLGNSSQKADTVAITKSFFASQSEIERLESLDASGYQITAQMVPMEEATPFSVFYRK